MSPIPRHLKAALIGSIAALTLVLPQSAVMAAAPAPDKIDKAVLADLAADDKATFWVHLKGSADLSSAAKAKTKTGKAEAVYRAKTAFADSSQAELIKLLKAAGAEYTPFWIANAVRVTGNSKLAATVVRTPQVVRIDPVRTIKLPEPIPGTSQAKLNAVEWNIDRVNAPRVWNELGTRGEGVVVANIDSGVQFDHPALAAQYRGKKADGTVDHNYNWFDPARVCSTAAPCDNNNHGTHTMGTMVGDDGGTNQIGVAPGAKWIAAKGCESNGCSDASLLAAGQWMLAPTDLNGANPRPDLAPDIVNNSWGGLGFDPWYKQIVDAWVAAGIFPVFSNGNVTGAGCNSSGSPGQYVASYSAGAFDINNAIAGFSTRGSGENGEIKPDIAAPGVNVRSSVNGGGYGAISGTSMAAPHVAGAAALLWSASPALDNDIAATRELLDRTAVDMNDTSCGGTAADNNVWGEGRLDAFAAVQAAPVGSLGALNGTVTSGGAAVAGATATVAGPQSRTVTTGPDGTYTLPRLLVGTYQITVKKFGYGDATATATVTAGQTATANVALTASPSARVSGTVISSGVPQAGAEVAAAGTPASAVTDAAGRYQLTLPHGAYDLKVTPASRCTSSQTAPITVGGDLAKDFDLPRRSDAFGHVCASGAEPYVAGTDKLALTGDDETAAVTLPFVFPLYGTAYSSGYISTNGFVNFAGRSSAAGNGPLPSASSPNAGIYPYWDDLILDTRSGIYTAILGTAPRRTFVVEWRDATFYDDDTLRISVSAALGEDGSVRFFYKDLDNARESGSGATVGIENGTGSVGFEYSHDASVLSGGQSLTFTASRHGLVGGLVTDANDGGPLAGATVKIGAEAQFTTGADGRFYGQAPVGDHKAEVSKEHYGTFVQDASVTAGALTGFDTTLATGRVTAKVDEVTLVMPADAVRTGSIELTNLGSATAYTVVNDPAQTWLTVTPAGGALTAGASATVKADASSVGVPPGTVRTGTLLIRSASGRKPEIKVTVRVVVPKHQVAVDVGGTKDVVDAVGDRWSTDRKYAAGAHGYVGTGSVRTTTRAIKGTSEQGLFKSARESMLEYRFDNVPNGTYTVELGFADLRSSRPGQRVFDVIVEDQLAVPALDLALQVGTHTAVTRQYTVKVADGQLNVRFAKRYGNTIVNAIRISERPDKVLP
ncbi:Serine protease, subtilisin family [Sinosporangium album]|uniref:Serine protease, subtilisin family n=1 Tax=Sinosporangium album TaxID=504805 RepID=A0A1G7TJV7_9ACTN|nr:S8 family serine peptidase [Sinosporangium album]SDG35616.1 Serine protease, subtilisin family [Sinosporangium album]